MSRGEHCIDQRISNKENIWSIVHVKGTYFITCFLYTYKAYTNQQKLIEFIPFPRIYVWMSPDREHDGPCSWPGWGTSLGSRPSTHCPGLHSATKCLPAPDSDLQHTTRK